MEEKTAGMGGGDGAKWANKVSKVIVVSEVLVIVLYCIVLYCMFHEVLMWLLLLWGINNDKYQVVVEDNL